MDIKGSDCKKHKHWKDRQRRNSTLKADQYTKMKRMTEMMLIIKKVQFLETFTKVLDTGHFANIITSLQQLHNLRLICPIFPRKKQL